MENQFTPSPTPEKQDLLQTASIYLNKLPPLPENWKNIFVKWYPWSLICGSLLAIPFILVTLGIISAASISSLGIFWLFPQTGKAGLLVILSVVMTIISLIAGWQMHRMKKTGWKLALIAEALGIINSLGNVTGLAVNLISIYFLWQVKDRYS